MDIKDYMLILQIKKNDYLAYEEFLLEHKIVIERCIQNFNLERDIVLDKIFDLILLDNYKLQKIDNLDSYIFSCIRNLKYSFDQKEKKECEKKYAVYQEYATFNLLESTNLYFESLLNLIDKDSAELLKLKYLYGLTLRQIAEMKGISKSKVDYKIKKAYRKMYVELSKEFIYNFNINK